MQRRANISESEVTRLRDRIESLGETVDRAVRERDAMRERLEIADGRILDQDQEILELRARVRALESGSLIPADVRDTVFYRAAMMLNHHVANARSALDLGAHVAVDNYQAVLVRIYGAIVDEMNEEMQKGSVH